MAGEDAARHAEVLERSAAEMTGALSVDADVLAQTSRALLRAAAGVPGADHVGFALVVRGALVAQPAGDPVVDDLDTVQAASPEGPAVDAATGRGTRHVPDLAALPCSSRLAEAAARHGLRGVLALPLTAHDGVLGVLTLWTRSTIDAHARAHADAIAAQATVALFGAQRIAGLARAVASRDLIGQAKGILMQRDGVDDEAAFGMLVEASQSTNIKLVDVAEWLVSRTGTSATPGTANRSADGVATEATGPTGATGATGTTVEPATSDRARRSRDRQGSDRGGSRP